MRISSELITQLSAAILRLYAPATPDELPKRFLSIVQGLLACENLAYNEFAEDRFSCLHEPAVSKDLSDIFSTYIDQHPSIDFVKRTNSTRTVKISDFVTTNEWHRSDLYNQFFRKLGIQHQIAFMFSVEGMQVGFAANRERRDFSEAHRFLLNSLSTHLSQAIANTQAMEKLQARLHQVADSPTCGGTIVFSDDEVVLFCSHKAADCVARFFGPIVTNRLPETLYRRLRPILNHPTLDTLSSGALQPLTIEGETSTLTVRLIPNHALNEHTLILEEHAISLPYSVFKDFGLTNREVEVLNWIVQGKTNPEIAIILAISVKTVGHHVEHIMSKLGVERRGAAALWAHQTLRSLHA